MGNLQQEYQVKLYDIKAGKLFSPEWLDYSKTKSMVIAAAFMYFLHYSEINRPILLQVFFQMRSECLNLKPVWTSIM